MAKGHIVTALDIGTHTIKIVVAQKIGNEWELVHYAKMASFGLRRGAITNPEETAKNIQQLIAGVEKEIGRKINSVFVNISGSHLYVVPSDGLISVSRADHIISQEDIDRVQQATRSINIPSNEEILDVFVREYIIDDQKGIKQPLGLVGVRLEAKVLLLCYFQSYFINLTHAVLNAKLQIDDIIPSPLAAANAVLTRQQKEIGVALIDIGAATSSLVVFEEGELMHLAVFPLGSANITNDLAIGLRTEVSVAEDIKKQYGSCMVPKANPPAGGGKKETRKKLEIADKQYPVEFTKKQLVDIIEPRAFEILDLMQKELKKIGRQELLPGGIVITGGGAKLPKIRELAKQQLKLPVEIGVPKAIVGLEHDPALSTVVGLVLASAEFDESESGSIFGISQGVIKNAFMKMRRMFRVFIP